MFSEILVFSGVAILNSPESGSNVLLVDPSNWRRVTIICVAVVEIIVAGMLQMG